MASFLTRPAALLFLLVLMGACAQQAPPPGGPVDDTPPEVIATLPAADSLGVNPPYLLTIEFSEKMNKRTVERNIRIFPIPKWIRSHWEGRIWFVETDRTTGETADRGEAVTVTLSGLAEDRRGNAMGAPYVFTYTSRDTLPQGVITGRVAGMQKAREPVPVTLRALLLPHGEEEARVALETEPSTEGEFQLSYLPTDAARPLQLLAFQDEDEDGEADLDFEQYGFSDTLRLAPQRARIDSVMIEMVNAETPATVSGTVTLFEDPDSVVVYAFAAGDTLPALAEPDSTGAFSLSLPKGEYQIWLLRGRPEEVLSRPPEEAREVYDRRSFRLEPGERREGLLLPEPAKEPQVTQ